MAVTRFRFQHPVDNAVADGQRDRLQIVGGLQLRSGAYQGVTDVPQYGLAQYFCGPCLRKKFRG